MIEAEESGVGASPDMAGPILVQDVDPTRLHFIADRVKAKERARNDGRLRWFQEPRDAFTVQGNHCGTETIDRDIQASL